MKQSFTGGEPVLIVRDLEPQEVSNAISTMVSQEYAEFPLDEEAIRALLVDLEAALLKLRKITTA